MTHKLRDKLGRFMPNCALPADAEAALGLHETTHAIVWIDPENEIFVLIDHVDYEWAKKWRWHTTPNSSKRKLYATRMTRKRSENVQVKCYMHKEILDRMSIPKPSPEAIIGDHINGNSLDNRRCNLRWATPRENSLNRKS